MTRGKSRGVGYGVCILQPAIFKNVFAAYNFSIISNPFDRIVSQLVAYLSSYHEKAINALYELA